MVLLFRSRSSYPTIADINRILGICVRLLKLHSIKLIGVSIRIYTDSIDAAKDFIRAELSRPYSIRATSHDDLPLVRSTTL
jgi:hypothetical protein